MISREGVFFVLYELRNKIWLSFIETKCYLMGSKHQFFCSCDTKSPHKRFGDIYFCYIYYTNYMYQLHVRVVKARVKGVATLDSMMLCVHGGAMFLTSRQRVSPSDQYPWARMRKLYCSYDYVQS